LAPESETLELTDARAIRALAHPVRMAILELLHTTETTTATECAREVGGSAQACSYHLRALAKWGFLRRAPTEDGRETRWELAAQTIMFASSGGSKEAEAAASLVKSTVLERDRRLVLDFLEHQGELESEWRDAASFTRAVVYATPDELEALERQVSELVGVLRRPTQAERPERARRADVVFYAIPKAEVKSNG